MPFCTTSPAQHVCVLLLNHENWSDLFLQHRPGPEVIPAFAANRQKPASAALPLVKSAFIWAASMAAVKARSHSQICLLHVPLSFSRIDCKKVIWGELGSLKVNNTYGIVHFWICSYHRRLLRVRFWHIGRKVSMLGKHDPFRQRGLRDFWRMGSNFCMCNRIR